MMIFEIDIFVDRFDSKFIHSMMFFIFYFLLFVSAITGCDEENCLLPSCQCAISNGSPTIYDTTDLPQLILLTFVGNINEGGLDAIRSILHPIHRNPNKCPITATFFVNHIDTDYCLVQRLFDNQHEIASTTASNRCPLTNCYDEYHWHRWTSEDWGREMKQQQIYLLQQAQIHPSHLKGFRAPRLQIDENLHLKFLKKFHFHYDSSMLFKASTLMWPFTLNYPLDSTNCINCNSSTQEFDALWQFPLHEWIAPNTTRTCRTLADLSCLKSNKTVTADLVYEFLLHNFQRHSSLAIGHRSPWVIELDFSWLSTPQNPRLDALLRFIKFILDSRSHRHVYFVSIEKALEWMKYPRSLAEIRDFWAFRCSPTPQIYNTDCSFEEQMNDPFRNATQPTGSLIDEKNKSKESTPLDRQGEKLFHSRIALHVVWVTGVLMLTVLFYDKYFTKK